MPALEQVVKRCLAKRPEDRWQNTSDLASELRWIADVGGALVTAGNKAVTKGRTRTWKKAIVQVHAGETIPIFQSLEGLSQD